MSTNLLATPTEAKVTQRQHRTMQPNDALAIALNNNRTSYHTYDLIRASQFLISLGLELQQELRQRYEASPTNML